MSEKTFADLGLSPEIVKSVENKGYVNPTPIQAGVIPLLLMGNKDIIGQAQTGTGKTAAFALPLLEKLDASVPETQAIVLAPTRELAMQVAKEIKSYSVPNSPSVLVVYGGNNMRGEITALRRNPQIVVGTPGRMQHHIRNKKLHLDTVRYFVLDEADEMLNIGFRDEIEEMLKMTPPQRRVLLFSATMPRAILNIVDNYMGDHDMVKIAAKEMTNENISHKYFCLNTKDKFEALCRIMENEESFYAIVFCRTRMNTDFVASQLIAKHLRAEAIHGDIDQNQREVILARFREGRTNILVATDVAARGIDITELNFVVNYSLPENFEMYTHRVGRTGRAGKKGVAITFVSRREVGRIQYFERNLNVKIERGTLPSAESILAKKQTSLIARLENIAQNENNEYLMPLAKQLADGSDPVSVIAALLKDSYGKDLNLKSYRNIVDEVPAPGGYRSGGGGGGGRPWSKNRKNGGKRRKVGRNYPKRKKANRKSFGK